MVYKLGSNIRYILRDGKIYLKGLIDGELQYLESPWLPYAFVENREGVEEILRTNENVVYFEKTDLKASDTKVNVIKWETASPKDVPIVRSELNSRGFRTYESDIPYVRRLLFDDRLKVDYDNRVVYLDIETDDSHGFPKEYGKYKIESIGVYDTDGSNKWFYVGDYNSEEEMLVDFVWWLRQNGKSVIVGWNVDFDWNHIFERLKFLKLRDSVSYFEITESIDLMEEYKKAVKGLSSYSLEEVSIHEGFERIKHRDKMIHQMSREELESYNMYDVELLYLIDKKYGFTEVQTKIAELVNLPLSDISSTRIGDSLFVRRLRELGHVMPDKKKVKNSGSYQGAFVLEPNPGLYEYVGYFDVNCLIEGTKVIVKDKGVINIEDVKEGDYVLGIRGWHRVKNVWKYYYSGEIINVNGLWSTPWHKHLIAKRRERQWMRKDYQARTLFREPDGKFVFRLLDFGDKKYDVVDEKLQLISELVGIIWAEGNFVRKDIRYFSKEGNKERVSRQYRIDITISADEVEFRDRILYILKTLYGYKPYIKSKEKNNSIVISISKKDIYEDIMMWNRRWEELHYPSVLRGFFEGDGTINVARKSIGIVQSVKNIDIVDRICYMLDRLGISYYRDVERNYTVKLPQGSYGTYGRVAVEIERYEDLVKFDALVGFISQGKYRKFKKCLEKKNIKVYGNVIKREAIKCESKMYRGYVYDLTLEGEPYFFANGILTHNSLYPNVIIHKNIDIDGFNGEVLPYIEKKLLNMRYEYKKKYKETGDPKYNVMQKAYKILANSLYGLLGTSSFRFYNKEKAAMITGGGREVLMNMKKYLEEDLGVKVLYSDTDSSFCSLKELLGGEGEFSEKEVLEVANAVADLINEAINPFAVKVEEVVRRILFFKATSGSGGAKKRYIGIKFDGSYLMRGVELRRSDWAPLSKEIMQRVVDIIFKEGGGKKEVMGYLSDMKKRMYKGEFDEKLIISKSLSKDASEYKVKPPHVRAYERALEKGYDFPDGRVKFVFVRGGNVEPIWDGRSVKELNLDYDWYWEHQIWPPIKRILDSIRAGKQYGGLDKWFKPKTL